MLVFVAYFTITPRYLLTQHFGQSQGELIEETGIGRFARGHVQLR